MTLTPHKFNQIKEAVKNQAKQILRLIEQRHKIEARTEESLRLVKRVLMSSNPNQPNREMLEKIERLLGETK